MQQTEVYARILGSEVFEYPKVVALFPEGVGGSMSADFEAVGGSPGGTSRVYGSVNQAAGSWNVPVGGGAELLGLDDVACVFAATCDDPMWPDTNAPDLAESPRACEPHDMSQLAWAFAP
jgi:hypothetical protein